MSVEYYNHFVARRMAGGVDESGMQFWTLAIVKVTGAHNLDDGRRWIEREEITECKTVRCCDESYTIEEGLRMCEAARAAS